MPHAQRIAEILLNIEAVKLSIDPPFTWTSGIKSPIYCDNRMLYSFPEERKFIVDALASRVKSLHIPPDVIAGTATAAIGWAALVAEKMNLPFVYVRAKPKEHGTQKRIEGLLKPDKHVVLIEDLISTAGSSVSSVEALRTEGKAVVTDIVSIFSYELPAAAEKAGQANVMLHPLSTFTTLINVACDNGEITPDQFALMKRFAKDPEAWGRAL